MNTTERNVMRAIRDALPIGKAGAVRLDDIRPSPHLNGAQFVTNDELDRTLQRMRNRGWIEYLAKRHPVTGATRRRWGWKITPVGTKAFNAPAGPS